MPKCITVTRFGVIMVTNTFFYHTALTSSEENCVWILKRRGWLLWKESKSCHSLISPETPNATVNGSLCKVGLGSESWEQLESLEYSSESSEVLNRVLKRAFEKQWNTTRMKQNWDVLLIFKKWLLFCRLFSRIHLQRNHQHHQCNQCHHQPVVEEVLKFST